VDAVLDALGVRDAVTEFGAQETARMAQGHASALLAGIFQRLVVPSLDAGLTVPRSSPVGVEPRPVSPC